MATANTGATAVGAVAADELYTLAEIKQRLQLGNYALRQARRRGLIVRKIGRRSYVLGKDVLDFITADSRQGVTRGQ